MKKQYYVWLIIPIMLGLPLGIDAALAPMPPAAYRTGTVEMLQAKSSVNTNAIEKESKGFFKRILVERVKSISKKKIGVAIVSILAGVFLILVFGFLIIFSEYLVWILIPSLYLIGVGLHWGGRGMKYFIKNKGEVADNPKKSKRRKVLLYLAGVVLTGILAALIVLLYNNSGMCIMCS